jgi:hypothetical protein
MKASIFLGVSLVPGLLFMAHGSEVVGGKAVPITECPWTVKPNQGCTGSWIGGKWAYSAKHCGTPRYISLGITKKSESAPANQVVVTKVTMHPSADIALLELANVPNVPVAKPIRLAGVADAAYFEPGDTCRLSGWGRLTQGGIQPDSVHMLDSPIAPASYQKETVMYWSGAKNGVMLGACNGDSGGPIAAKDATGAWIQVSAVTGGGPVCGNEMPDYGPKMAYYEAWFKQQMASAPVQIGPSIPLGWKVPILLNGRIRLMAPQVLALSVHDAAGREIWSSQGFYAAGEHALPKEASAPQPSLLVIKGEAYQIQRMGYR